MTIDLDGAWCYRAIHGAAGPHDDDDDPVLLQGLPRFLELCARHSITATLFVVGADLRHEAYARLIEGAARAGHEVMSHSHSHAYDLSRWPRSRIVDDVKASIAAITAVTGVVPEGFRAPGYNLSPTLLDAVKDAGLRWSSSWLPAPAYFAARALVIARTTLLGRRSASLFGDPGAFAPLRRRRHALRRQHANGLLEFPISAPWGIPFTGTMLALLPDRAARWLSSAAGDDDDVMLELHAADFVEGALLPPGQPDRLVPLADKLGRIERAVRALA
ncbi:MAG: polysaccharide deacetylase family protein [Deltaproteobacteria bacterium]|nr:polysaccharide deacetylase family protein [Deltaproteobacteria bacterium]